MLSFPIMSRTTTTAVLLAGLAISTPALATTVAGDPDWKPRSSERLVKLPASYLKKSIDHDFADSALGKALQGAGENIGLKMKTLGDLQEAIAGAEGELRTELRHQLLAEKRAFVELMSRKNELRRKYVDTKQRLFEDMMKRLSEKNGGASPTRRALVKRQTEARKRFESTLSTVDTKLFEATAAPGSKYSQKYSKNMAAVEKLVGRIQAHRMNPTSGTGEAISKEEHLRQLVAETQADMSILEQEDTILGYMAKLVALDAMALSEEALDAELADSDLPADTGPSGAVDLFMTN
jgi:hypothetical protein